MATVRIGSWFHEFVTETFPLYVHVAYLLLLFCLIMVWYNCQSGGKSTLKRATVCVTNCITSYLCQTSSPF